MKFFIAIVVGLFSITAGAWEVEAGVGAAQAGMPPDGQYWQQPFSHQFQMQGQAASLGVTDTFTAWSQSIRWRVYGLYLGKFSGSANAVQDERYDHRSATGCTSVGCGEFGVYNTELTTRGVVASLAPEFNAAGITVSPEFGVHCYIPKFDETVYDPTRPSTTLRYYHYKGGLNCSPMWGAGVAYGSVRVSLKQYVIDQVNRGEGEVLPPNIANLITVVAAEMRF